MFTSFMFWVTWWPILLNFLLVVLASSPPPGCPTCVLDRQQQHVQSSEQQSDTLSTDFLRLEAIKQQILSKLGLSSKPNVSSPIPHEVLLETMRIVDDTRIVHHKRTPDLEDDFYGRTSEIISFAEPGPRINGHSLLEFSHTGQESAELHIKSALLWVRWEMQSGSRVPRPPPLHHHLHKKITLLVFRVLPFVNTTHLSGKGEEFDLATSLDVTLDTLGWQKFDISDAVQEWYSLGPSRGKLRLLVDCGSAGCRDLVKPSLSLEPLHPWRHHQVHQHHRPFLVLHTDPGATKRQRRHALECRGTVNQCCKERFFVNFTQLGWNDWIIAPRGYYANYCRGHCVHRTPDSFLNYYTHVMEKYRQKNQLPGMQPCCSPVRFSPISLIYIDPDYNIIKQDLPKMSVDECGCP